MSHSRYRWLGIILPSFIALALSLTLIMVSSAQVYEPESPAVPVPRYVAPSGNDSGNDCSSSATPCATLQHAVDVAAAGDELRAAEGAYTGTQLFTRTLYSKLYSYTQVVYINKSLTVRGGYSTGNWESSDPEAHPTVIDAEQAGRGVTIIDTINDPVNFEGFTITGGDYTGLGNPSGEANLNCGYRSSDCGGGILVVQSAANLRRLVVRDNTGGTSQNEGGGLYFDHARAVTIEDSLIISNSADLGGGMFVYDLISPLTIRRSIFQDNRAYGSGGAMSFGSGADDLITIEETQILSNTAFSSLRGDGDAGGMYIRLANDGLLLEMNRVTFQNNRGAGMGKVLLLEAAGPYTPTARLENLLFVGNGLPVGAPVADDDALVAVGPGFTNINTYFSHVTAADNDVGGFLYAQPDDHGIDLVQVVLTNTLLVGFDNAFIARQSDPGQVIVEHRNTLLQNVTNQHLNLDGAPLLIATNPITGDAKLDASYHLQSGSDAIDAGLETGVTDDIDGQFRPQTAAPDIGSDEYLEMVGLATLVMSGPLTVVANTDNTFAAEVGPINVTRPLTYYWSATGLDDVIHTAGLSDTVSFNWPTTGSKSISLTVSNMVAGRGDTYAVTVISAPSLAIEKSGPAEALAGSQITYELTVANSGVAAASGQVITDTVPAHTTSVTALDGGSVNSGLVQWNLASLAGGSEATVRFQVTANQTIVNDDYAVTAVGGYSAVGTTPVTTIFGQPQLAIVKSGPIAAAPGQAIVYDLTISNTGLISATDVVVSDTLPPGASYVSGGQLIDDMVRWQIDSIAANGGLAKVSFTASANATVTNSDYEVTAAGGFGAQGSVDVSTIIGTGTRYVAKSGSDGLSNCTNSAAPCATIQHAANVANPGEEIRVAEGTYAGTQWVTAENGYAYKQVLFVGKGLTVRGGYSTSNWTTSDPTAHPTILDAQGSGRGVTIVDTANSVVTIEGFTVTGGNYTGLGNPGGVANQLCDLTGYDCGGGILASNSAANLRQLIVRDNIAGSGDSAGGGIFIWPARATTIETTQVVSNSAKNGGGLYLADTILPINISDSEFRDNLADEGGGISLSGSIDELVTVSRVDVISNTAAVDSGGGIYARMSEDGLILIMDRVRLQNNRATDQGKALRLDAAGSTIPRASLSNLLLSGNGRTDGAPVTDEEAVVAVQTKFSSMEVSLKHVSAAGNTVANFLYVEPREHAGYFASVILTNTLLSGFENAYAAKEVGPGEATIHHEKTLLHNVSNQHANLGGTPGFTAVDAISGDPKLDGAYHLTTGSAAIDVAVATDVSIDIDGDSRPLGGGPDIGADEFVPSPPGAFGKAGPGDGAANQATAPILSWQPSSGAATYELCYDSTNNNACEGGWIDAGSVLSKTVGGLSSGTTYYWQVRAVNVLGYEEADAGTWWSFTTGTPPAAFGKSGPANGAGNLTTSPTISWSDPGNATSFEVCYDTLNDNSCGGEWQDAGSNLNANLSGLSYGTSYYWQVRAVNSIGQTGADGGSWWLFTTGNRPGHFDKISPVDGATIETTALDLSWDESSDAVSYEYCYDTSDDDTCNGGWTSAGGNTSAAISGLSAGTTYYWQVKAVNTLDNREANNWSWWSFTVASAPAAFGKSSPSDGAGDQSGSPTLSWQASAGAASYEYCYDLTGDDSCDGSWLSAGSNTSVALTGLLYEQRYYWQVRALNGLGTELADGDTWWSFEIMEAPYSVRLPLLLRP